MVGRKDRRRALLRPKALPRKPEIDEPFDLEDEDSLDIPASELRLGIAVLDWWEVVSAVSIVP